MPQASDGSIVIDTSLDNSGFEKGSKELISAAKDITDTINKLGTDMTAGFTKIIPILETIANQTTQINSKMATAADEAASTTSKVTAAEEQLHEAAGQTTAAVDEQSNSMKDFGEQAQQAVEETKASIDTQSEAVQDFGEQAQQAVEETKTAIDSQGESMQDFVDGTHEAASGMQESAKSVSNFDKELSKIQQKIDTTKAKLADYYSETEKIEQATEEMLAKAETDEQARVTNEIADAQLAELNRKYAEQLKLLAELEAEYNRIVALKQQEATTAEDTPEPDVEDTEALDKELSGILKKLDQYEAKVAKMGTLGATDSQWKSVAYDIDNAELMLDSYREKLEELQEMGSIPTEDYERLSGDVEEAATRFSDLKSVIPVPETYSFRDALKSAASSALGIVGNLAKNGFKAIGKGIKSAVKRLQTFRSESKKSTSLINGMTRSLTSLKTMLLSRIKRTFISSIIDTAKAGLGDLAKFDSGFDAAMSNIKNSTKQAGHNLSVSLGTVISAVEPFATAVINAMNSALTHVNALMSALGGKSTVTLAKTQTDSYAKSLDGAAKNAKELNKQVYGFDELNKRSDDNTSSASDFLSENVADILSKQEAGLADRIKRAIASGDWYGLGKEMISGFNSAVKTVDKWIKTKLRQKGVQWADDIAEILNGATESFDPDATGQLISDGFNTAFAVSGKFFETYRFRKLGEKAAGLINKIFSNEGIDFQLIGKTLGSKLRGVIAFAFEFLTTANFENIGTRIAEFINGALAELDSVDPETGKSGWEELGISIAASLNGILDAFNAFLDTLNTEEVKQGISDALSTFWDGLDIDTKIALSITLGILTINGITGLLFGKGVLALITTSIGKQITGPINAATPALSAAFSNLAKVASIGAVGLFDAVMLAYDVKALSEAADTYNQALTAHNNETETALNSYAKLYADKGKEAADEWAEMVYQIDTTNMSFDQAQQALTEKIESYWDDVPQNMWDGFKQGWNYYFGEDGEGLGALLVDAFRGAVKGVKDFLGIHSQSAVFAGIGENLIQGLFNGIKEKWEALKESVKGLGTGLIDKFESIFQIGSPSKVFARIGAYLDEGLENGIDDGKSSILSTVRSLAEDVAAETNEDMELGLPEYDTFRTLDAITDKLSGIARIFERITDTINSLGGFVMPQIAAGSVIPVKTRIETAPVSCGDANGYTDYVAGMDEQMSEEIYLLKQIIAILRTLNLNIDIDALTQMLTNQQNTRKLNFGGV